MRRAALGLIALAVLALPSAAQASSKLLLVSKAGSRSGTVTSSPAGIECGGGCSASFPEGATVTLTGAPGPGAAPAQWSGCDSVSAEDRCVVAMNGPRSVTATFEPPSFALTVSRAGDGTGTVTSSPAGIECGSKCSHSFLEATTVTLTGAPGAGTEAVAWSGCDSIVEGKCKVTMGSARNVVATFNLLRFALAVTKAGVAAPYSSVTSTPAGIACGGACGARFLQGASVTLIAAPAPQGKPVVWSGCAPVSGHPSECKVTMSEAKAVTATFELQPIFSLVTLSVAKSGTGQGTVTATGGISCGSACSAQLISSTQATLSAVPAPGSVFTRWSGGCTGAGTCTTTLKASKTVTAVFTLSGQRTLTVTKAGSGQGTVTAKAVGIECGQACSSQVAAAKKVTLTAKPAAGSAFAHWSGACSGTAKTCKVTMSEARSVTATFNAPPGAQAQAAARCVVPKLKGKTLKAARAALSRAHCSLGKVKRPKRGRRLIVRSFSPGAGTSLAAGAKVGLKLAPKPKRR